MNGPENGNWKLVARRAVVVLLGLSSHGCAIQYFDPRSGTEHLFGIGHMAMRVQPSQDGIKAVADRTDDLGFSVGTTPEGFQLGVGWNARQRVQMIDPDAQVCMAWPVGSFLDVRVGTSFPEGMQDCAHPSEGGKKP